MKSHFHEMKSVFHEMKWNRIRTETLSCRMRLRNHEMKQNKIRMKAFSCKMRSKIFSWDEMRSNLCEMRAFNLMSSQNWNQNRTRFWWNESFYSDFTVSLLQFIIVKNKKDSYFINLIDNMKWNMKFVQFKLLIKWEKYEQKTWKSYMIIKKHTDFDKKNSSKSFFMICFN